MANTNKQHYSIVVVGGGIAATTCVHTFCQSFDEQNKVYDTIVLISNSRLVKVAKNFNLTGRQLETFDVANCEISETIQDVPFGLHVKTIIATVTNVVAKDNSLTYVGENDEENTITYDKLCICTGAKPKNIQLNTNGIYSQQLEDKIIVIRDTDTVLCLQKKLTNCRRLAIIGNGGISLETVYKISNCNKTWIVKDSSVGLTFFDSGAEKFLLDSLTNQSGKQNVYREEKFKLEYASAQHQGEKAQTGCAMGPNWTQGIELKGTCDSNDLKVIYNDEVSAIQYLENEQYPIRITTINGLIIDCDLVVAAIGVKPNTNLLNNEEFNLSENDLGLLIDSEMRTSVSNVYGAGDVVSCDNWPFQRMWFQMRLWTQARQMGYYAAKCIKAHLEGSDPALHFIFECFTHVTKFLGHKVVLLGRFNGQELENLQILVRINPPDDYVKLLIDQEGRIVGAVLIGNSGLEETIENLINDQIDVSQYKEQLLDNTVDIEDYFD